MRIEPGAAVEATDGRLGTVDEVVIRPEDGGLAYLVVRRGWSNEQLLVPAELIRAVDGSREVRLGVTRDEARDRAAAIPPDALLLARDRGAEVVIPIVEERLIPEKRKVDLGELRVHKLVDEVDEAVRRPVTRDDLVVERVQVNQPLDEPVGSRYEGDWLVIPIMREVLVVTKQLMLVEEVRISKRAVTEEQEVHQVTRHERLEIEDATLHGVAGLDAAPAAAGSASPTRPTGPVDPAGFSGTDEPTQAMHTAQPASMAEPLADQSTQPPAAQSARSI